MSIDWSVKIWWKFKISLFLLSRGYKVVLSTTPALQNSGNTSLTEFHKRLVRWSQLRISMVPTLIVLEPVGESIVLGVFSSWAANFLLDISPLAFLLSHLLVWFLFDYILFRVVEVSTFIVFIKDWRPLYVACSCRVNLCTNSLTTLRAR